MTSKSLSKLFVLGEYKKFLNELKILNPKLYRQLCNKIKEIKSDPFKSKFKSLKNTDNYRRARSGEYRIVYFVEDNDIFIVRIGLRKNVYKRNFSKKYLEI